MDDAQRRAWHALDLGPVWVRRVRDDAPAEAPPPGAVETAREGPGAVDAVATATAVEAAVEAEAPPAPSIAVQPVLAAAGPADAARGGPGGNPVDTMSWAELRAAVADCRACGLCRTRTQTVFGVGSEQSRWLLVGEAPGAEEDARGEPFVGQAGRLLDGMLASLALARGRDVFIANVLKCRPPNNRNPEPQEVARCEPFLHRQIALLSPDVIVVLGRFAAQSLLRTEASVSSLRGRVHRYRIGERAVPLVVTFHPAYLLRNLPDKAKAWADLCLAQAAFEAG